jgi:hypothetical protein
MYFDLNMIHYLLNLKIQYFCLIFYLIKINLVKYQTQFNVKVAEFINLQFLSFYYFEY